MQHTDARGWRVGAAARTAGMGATALVLLALAGCGGGRGTAAPQAAGAAPTTATRLQAGTIRPDAAVAPSATTQALFAAGSYGTGVSDWSWNLCAPPLAAFQSRTVLLYDQCQGGAWSAGGYLHVDTPVAAATALDFDVWLPDVATAAQVWLSFGASSPGIALATVLPSPQAGAWNHVRVDLVPQLQGGPFQDLMMMNSSGHPRFYVDNVQVTAGATNGGPVAITVDVQAGRKPISPEIYGVNEGTAAQLAALNAPVARYGGNAASQYNWQINASNRAASWFFESIDSGPAVPGKYVSDFVGGVKQAGAAAMVTLPMLDWVAKLGPNRSKLASFSVAKYGPQQTTDWQWFPDAGNGRRPDGTAITGNDPNDANVPATPSFHQGLVQLLVNTHGNAAAGGARYYLMDNEPGIWHEDQRNVHPQGTSLDELYAKIVATASMVKATDPTALVVAPDEWGWSNYFASGKDTQLGLVWNGPDRAAHGGMDAMPWLLQALRQRELQTGQRLLDVFSLHYYPQGGDERFNTRSLWDPNYVDPSWINDRIALIPRMKAWVNQYYPGLKIALTEYSWWNEGDMRGATAQADVLGILGREGVDIATRWVIPPEGSPTFKAIQMYRNVDGRRIGFGDVSVATTVPNPDVVAAFGAQRSSDSAVTVMVINKDPASTHALTLTVNNLGLRSGPVKRFQLTGANVITPLADMRHAAGVVTDTLPAQSVTLYVFLLRTRS